MPECPPRHVQPSTLQPKRRTQFLSPYRCMRDPASELMCARLLYMRQCASPKSHRPFTLRKGLTISHHPLVVSYPQDIHVPTRASLLLIAKNYDALDTHTHRERPTSTMVTTQSSNRHSPLFAGSTLRNARSRSTLCSAIFSKILFTAAFSMMPTLLDPHTQTQRSSRVHAQARMS